MKYLIQSVSFTNGSGSSTKDKRKAKEKVRETME